MQLQIWHYKVSADLISEVAGQIPEIISYSANAKSIEVQSAVMDRLLDLKRLKMSSLNVICLIA